jgi:hypothetical protein
MGVAIPAVIPVVAAPQQFGMGIAAEKMQPSKSGCLIASTKK